MTSTPVCLIAFALIVRSRALPVDEVDVTTIVPSLPPTPPQTSTENDFVFSEDVTVYNETFASANSSSQEPATVFVNIDLEPVNTSNTTHKCSSECSEAKSNATQVDYFSSEFWRCACSMRRSFGANGSDSCDLFFEHLKQTTNVQLRPVLQAVCDVSNHRELVVKLIIAKLIAIAAISVAVYVIVRFAIGKSCVQRFRRHRKSESYWLDGPVSLEWDPTAEPTACRVWHINEAKDNLSSHNVTIFK